VQEGGWENIHLLVIVMSPVHCY